jgi:hypothetical protein
LARDTLVAQELTYAADYLMRIMPEKHLPSEHRAEFEEIQKALTSIPLSTQTGYTPRPLTPEEGSRLAERILSLYIQLRGGI